MKKLFGFWCLFLLFSCRTQGVEKHETQPVVKSDKANIVSYTIKDRNGGNHSFNIDDVKGILSLTLPYDHSVNLTEVKPVILISKNATISPTAEQVCDFSSADKSVSYTVISESGKKKSYTASVKVLPKRKNLEVESIKIHGKLVESNQVTIGEDCSTVQKSNIEVKFKGENTPTDFSISQEILRLNSFGDSGVITLSTSKTDMWNAWSQVITVIRGGKKHVPSTEKKMLTFEANGVSGSINQNSRTVTCVLPSDVEVGLIRPIITCSKNAMVFPPSGYERDFKDSHVTPLTYTVTAEDGSSEVYSVSITRRKSSVAKIISFKVGSVNAKIDDENGRISVEVDRSISLNSIAPNIQLSKYATVNPESGVQGDFSNSIAKPLEYIVTAEDGSTTKKYEVTITHKKSNKAEITLFKVGNVEAVIDQNSNTIKAEVEKSVDLKKIRPEIVASEYAVVSPKSGDEKDFSNSENEPVRYNVTSEDGSTTKKYEVTIIHKKSNKAEITLFKVGNVEAVIDQNSNTIKAEVEKSVDLKKIRPEIVASEYAVVSPKSGDEKDFSNSENEPVRYNVTSEDLSKIKGYNVTITHKKSSEARIISFKIGDVKGKINSDDTIDVLLKFGTDLTDITPAIEISQYAKISPANGVKQDFSNGKTVEYTVTSESGEVKNKYTVYVKKNLPETKIKIFDKFYEPTGVGKGTIKIPKDKNEIKKADIEITYEEGGQTIKVSQDNYRIEGDQTTLIGESGTMTLKILLTLGAEYLLNVPMIIEVSK
ncbi:MAG: DUF5018 domain-containing protein [Treponema sp.]